MNNKNQSYKESLEGYTARDFSGRIYLAEDIGAKADEQIEEARAEVGDVLATILEDFPEPKFNNDGDEIIGSIYQVDGCLIHRLCVLAGFRDIQDAESKLFETSEPAQNSNGED